MNNLNTVLFVGINPSEYRQHCFDSKLESVVNSRWQLDLYIHNVDSDDNHLWPVEDHAPLHVACTVHFTAYDIEQDDKQGALNFYMDALAELFECYKMDWTAPIHDTSDIAVLTYDDCNIDNGPKGLTAFINNPLFKSPIALYGQPLTQLFDDLSSAQYLYYSSLKLLSYPMGEGCVCGGNSAYNNIAEFEYFLANPPLLKPELLQVDNY